MPALIGLGGVAVGSLISWVGQALLLRRRIEADERLAKDKSNFDKKLAGDKFDFDKELAERKFSYDRELAERKLRDERALHDHKRRVELAEEVLADFYRCADVIRAIRSPGSFKGEASDRVRRESETPDESGRLDAYFVTIARLKQNSGFLSNLMSKRYRSHAVLGTDIDEAFDKVQNAVFDIQMCATMLSSMVERGGAAFQLNKALVRKYESTIFQHMPGDDPIEPTIKHAIEVVEMVCRPIVERRS